MNEPPGVELNVGGEGRAPKFCLLKRRGRSTTAALGSREVERVLRDNSHWAFYGDNKETLLSWEAQGWQGGNQPRGIEFSMVPAATWPELVIR